MLDYFEEIPAKKRRTPPNKRKSRKENKVIGKLLLKISLFFIFSD